MKRSSSKSYEFMKSFLFSKSFSSKLKNVFILPVSSSLNLGEENALMFKFILIIRIIIIKNNNKTVLNKEIKINL